MVEDMSNNQDDKRVWFDGDFINIQVSKKYIYDIPVSRMKTAAAVLDWIHQVCVSKVWGPEITSELLKVIYHEVIPTEMWSGKS
jgi:hypothetical protein